MLFLDRPAEKPDPVLRRSLRDIQCLIQSVVDPWLRRLSRP
ncbi:MAG: hypothetical protein QW086_07160 [Pyrobaculum sp.]